MFSSIRRLAKQVLKEAGMAPRSATGRELVAMMLLGAEQWQERARRGGVARETIDLIWLTAREMPLNESALGRAEKALGLTSEQAGDLLGQVRDAATAVFLDRRGLQALTDIVAEMSGPSAPSPAAPPEDAKVEPAASSAVPAAPIEIQRVAGGRPRRTKRPAPFVRAPRPARRTAKEPDAPA